MILWFLIATALVLTLVNWLCGTFIHDAVVRGWAVFLMGIVYTLIILGLVLTIMSIAPELFLLKPLTPKGPPG